MPPPSEPPPCYGSGPDGGLTLSVGLVYISMAVFGLCGTAVCISVVYYWNRVAKNLPVPVGPYKDVTSATLALKGQATTLALEAGGVNAGAPRDAVTVKAELLTVLKRVEELKAELSTIESLNEVLDAKPKPVQIIASRQM